ncbi:MAG TPA: hypothetical protein VN285_12340 [Candidatus Deferrimicrobium sp.]|nr:hypothetical protein [Candidatus Deferrimicrobium sp.]
MDLKFTKPTDSEEKIELESSLVSASWRCGKAIAGLPAPFEVRTAFVGEGAPIKVTGKSENGEKLGKIKDAIRGNVFVGEFEIPEDAEVGDQVYFEVELSKNDLSGESERIPVYPPVRVFNLKWSATQVRRGDILTLSADTTNLTDGSEVTVIIYEYDRDKAHDKVIELPVTVAKDRIELKWEFEYQGDIDKIPTQKELDKYGGKYQPPQYFFTVKVESTEFGSKQESGLVEFKDWLVIEFKGLDGLARANENYAFELADGSKKKGQLDAAGKVRLEDIPPGPCWVEFPDAKSSTETQAGQKTGSGA